MICFFFILKMSMFETKTSFLRQSLSQTCTEGRKRVWDEERNKKITRILFHFAAHQFYPTTQQNASTFLKRQIWLRQNKLPGTMKMELGHKPKMSTAKNSHPTLFASVKNDAVMTGNYQKVDCFNDRFMNISTTKSETHVCAVSWCQKWGKMSERE